MKAYGTVLLLLLLCLGLGSAEEAGVHLSPAQASTSEGDPLEITIEAWWPQDWQVADAADPLLAFGEVYVRQWEEYPAWRDGDSYRQRWTLSIQAEDSGPWPLPRVSMYWYDAAGALQQRRSDPVVVMVDVPGVDADIGSGMGLWRPSVPASGWWWGGSAAALLGLLVLLGWWWMRRRRRPLTPRQRLQQALQAIAVEEQASHAMGLLAQALRAFASEHWGLPLRGASVSEVGQMLDQHPQSALRELSQILADIDRDRWTPEGTSRQRVLAMHGRSQQWLEQLQQQEPQL